MQTGQEGLRLGPVEGGHVERGVGHPHGSPPRQRQPPREHHVSARVDPDLPDRHRRVHAQRLLHTRSFRVEQGAHVLAGSMDQDSSRRSSTLMTACR